VKERYVLPSERWDRKQRRVLGWSLLVSAVLHGIFFVAWRGSSSAPAGGPAESAQAAPTLAYGGGALLAISVSAPRPFEIPAPPELAELTDEPALDVLEVGGPVSVTLGRPGPAQGDASGSGSSPGPGLGGTGSRTTSPVPRSIVPEWDPPGDVRGTRVTARVLVSAEGQPLGEVQLVPPTPDQAFNRRLVEKVLQMQYIPGRRDGEPVEAWAEITFVF
jgi:hypothetical protein